MKGKAKEGLSIRSHNGKPFCWHSQGALAVLSDPGTGIPRPMFWFEVNMLEMMKTRGPGRVETTYLVE